MSEVSNFPRFQGLISFIEEKKSTVRVQNTYIQDQVIYQMSVETHLNQPSRNIFKLQLMQTIKRKGFTNKKNLLSTNVTDESNPR